MRICPRCNTEMLEHCYVENQGVAISHLVVVERDESLKKVERPVMAALCKECGYVEFYVEKRTADQSRRQPHPTPKKYYFTDAKKSE